MTLDSASSDCNPSFTPAMFHILLVLSDHECHGYGIMQEVSRQSAGTVRLAPGTLYRSIKHLLMAGLVAESDVRPDRALDDERRRYYRITPRGLEAVKSEAGRLASLVGVARAKHLLPRGRDPVLDVAE